MSTRFFLIVSFLLLIPFASPAQEEVTVLDDETEIIVIGKNHLYMYIDGSGDLTYSDVMSPVIRKHFIPVEADLPKNNDLDATYWTRFTLRNESKKITDWILEIPDCRTREYTLYDTKDNGDNGISVGTSFPFSHKYIDHKNFHIPVTLQPGEERTFLAKIHSTFPIGLLTKAWNRQAFASYAFREYYILGLFYGFLFLMAVYNFFMFLKLKDWLYLVYVGYVLAIGIYLGCQDGTSFQFLWPEFPEFYPYSYSLFLGLTIVFAILFARLFLHTKEAMPTFDRILLILAGIRALLMFISFGMEVNFLFFNYMDSILLLVIYVGAVRIYRKGNKAARFFVIAYTLLFLGFMVTMLKEYTVLPNNILTVYALNFGVIFEIMFLSLAIADKFRQEVKLRSAARLETIEQLEKNEKLNARLIDEMEEREKEKERINEELETLVRERNRELHEANDKLQHQSEEINRMNQMLDKYNTELKKDLTNIEKARITGKDLDFDEFKLVYPDEVSCMEYLSEVKWKESYACKKCENDTYGRGKEPYARRCKKCGYNESVTAFTLFHKLKFPLQKAFYILFLEISLKEKFTVDELSEKVDLRRATAWTFSKKIKSRQEELINEKKNPENWENVILQEST